MLRRLKTLAAQREPWLIAGLLALVFRLLYVLLFPQYRIEGGDAPLYLQLADAVRSGSWPEGLTHFYQPLYVWFLAGVRTVFGSSLLAVRVVQAFASAGTVAVMAWIGTRWADRRTGLAAGLFGALCMPMILDAGVLYTETIFTFILTAAVALVLRALRDPSRRAALIAGAALAAAGLTREIGFYLGFVLSAGAAVRRRSVLLFILLAVPSLLAMGAWAMRTKAVASREPQASSAPLLSKGYEKTLTEPTFAKNVLSPRRWPLVLEGAYLYFRLPHHLMDLGVRDVSVRQELASGEWERIRPIAAQALAKGLMILMHLAWLVLAAYGLWKGKLARDAKILFALAVAFMGVAIIVKGMAYDDAFPPYIEMSRYRFPIDPLILILAASGAAALEDRLRGKKA